MIRIAFGGNGEKDNSIALVVYEWFQLLQNQVHFKIRKIAQYCHC